MSMSLADLERNLSLPRLNKYRSSAASDAEAMCLYVWNMALSAAFQPAIHALEVTLRNGCVRIGTSLAARERAGRGEASASAHRAAASSAMTAAQRSWKRRRRSASATGSPERAWARKY